MSSLSYATWRGGSGTTPVGGQSDVRRTTPRTVARLSNVLECGLWGQMGRLQCLLTDRPEFEIAGIVLHREQLESYIGHHV